MQKLYPVGTLEEPLALGIQLNPGPRVICADPDQSQEAESVYQDIIDPRRKTVAAATGSIAQGRTG